MKGSIVNVWRMHIPKRALVASLLVLNMLMATRFSVSRSVHPILRKSPKRISQLTSKHLHKSQSCPLWSSSFSFCLQSLHKSKTTSLSFSTSSACPPSSLSMAASATASAVDDLSLKDNPLLQDFEFPPFDVVKAEHVRPGIRALLKQLVLDFFFLFLFLFVFLLPIDNQGYLMYLFYVGALIVSIVGCDCRKVIWMNWREQWNRHGQSWWSHWRRL